MRSKIIAGWRKAVLATATAGVLAGGAQAQQPPADPAPTADAPAAPNERGQLQAPAGPPGETRDYTIQVTQVPAPTKKDPNATNETTDAYDSIEWLIKNVPNNNGKVGMYGVSYDGLTTAMALLHPHPALKAISEQASPVDQWMNDDMHRYGALRESYALEYAVLEQADKNKNSNFEFETYDTYEWYLKAGPLSSFNDKYIHGKIPFWNDTVEHPNYDQFWKKEAWVNQLHASAVPNLNVNKMVNLQINSRAARLALPCVSFQNERPQPVVFLTC